MSIFNKYPLPYTMKKEVYEKIDEEIEKLKDGSSLEADSVSTGNIEDDSITTDKIANVSVTTDKIANGAVENEQLADESVTPSKTLDIPVLYNLGAPDVADDDAVVTAEAAGENKEYTLTAEPYECDVPRNITVTRNENTNPDTIGNITVVGTDINDEEISEEFVVGADTVEVLGDKAFKTVTAVTGSTYTIADVEDTIKVGIGDKIGSPVPIKEEADVELVVLGTAIVAADAVNNDTTVVESTIDANGATYDGAKVLKAFIKNSD